MRHLLLTSATTFTPVSIHASVKDATVPNDVFGNLFDVSIHASVKDATVIWLHNPCLVTVSIHASVKDATKFPALVRAIPGFNPRICKRCDA